MRASTQRFSNRVENYLRYRPGYPPQIVDLLRGECGLSREAIVADVGSGTGKLTELLLPHAKQIFAIEPNPEMRMAGEHLLRGYSNFTSIFATAEATTLPDHSVDLIVAAQAFHWFDRDRAKAEFSRILKPGGYVALIWNDRQTDSSPFLKAYEELLRSCGTDYQHVNHRNVTAEKLQQFFGRPPNGKSFPNHQCFDYEGVRGRLLSSSYAPAEDEPDCAAMLNQLRTIFETYVQNGAVAFRYDTLVYYDPLM